MPFRMLKKSSRYSGYFVVARLLEMGFENPIVFVFLGPHFVPLSIADVADKDAGMSEPPKAVSFQRSGNSEKHKEARRAGTAGCALSFDSFSLGKQRK